MNSPFYNTEFKSRANAAVTWAIGKAATTLYVERYGRTPNYLAQQTVAGYAQPGAGDVSTWTIANLSAKYDLTPQLEVTGNINNLFNRFPPKDSSQPGIANQPFSIFNYNNYGRSYFVGVSYKFGK